MPTVTTTVTSAAATGVTTTVTSTVASPDGHAITGDAALIQTVIGEWGAGTLTANKANYFAPGCNIDWGSNLNFKHAKAFGGFTFDTIDTWLEGIHAEWTFGAGMDWDFSNVRGGAVAEFTWDCTNKASGLSPPAIRDMIRYTVAGGKITTLKLFLSDPTAIAEACIPPAITAGLATNGFMLTEPEVAKEDLKGQVALVTGGSRGIGKYAALHLAKCGMKVVVAARSTDLLKGVVAEIQAAGGEAMYVTLDTSKEEQFAPAFAAIEAKFGPVRYCFANAAVANNFKGEPHTWQQADMDYVWDINLKGTMMTFTNCHKHFTKHGGGVFVMNASSGGSMPGEALKQFAGGALYCASKAAVNDLVKSLGAYYIKDNIRMYSVCPFAYSTYMLEHIASDISDGALSCDDISAVNPMFPGKSGNPMDIAPLIEAFFDGDTLYAHGGCVEMDGYVSFSTQLKWDRMGHLIDQDAGQALFSACLKPEECRDARGRPLSAEELAKIPGLGGVSAFHLDV